MMLRSNKSFIMQATHRVNENFGILATAPAAPELLMSINNSATSVNYNCERFFGLLLPIALRFDCRACANEKNGCGKE